VLIVSSVRIKTQQFFYLKASNPAFLDDLSHCPGIPIVPKHIWQDVEDPANLRIINLLGRVHLNLRDRISGQYVKLVANEKYHGAKPHVNEVVFEGDQE
jgi:peptide/nickel transport system substrate-binding protein